MIKFAKGDRVRLMTSMVNRDMTRVGVVTSTPKSVLLVTVRWDGMATVKTYNAAYLEKIDKP